MSHSAHEEKKIVINTGNICYDQDEVEKKGKKLFRSIILTSKVMFSVILNKLGTFFIEFIFSPEKHLSHEKTAIYFMIWPEFTAVKLIRIGVFHMWFSFMFSHFKLLLK